MHAFFLILMFAATFGAIIFGVRVILALTIMPLLIAGLAALSGSFDAYILTAIPQRIYGILANPVLQAVPLFILMGKVLEHSGLVEDLLNGLARSGPGNGMRLGFGVLVIAVVIAASTGIVGATITLLGVIALPAMLRSGLSEKLSAGLICASGSLGQIIPPSIMLVLLADQVSNAWQASQRALGNFAVEPVTVGHVFAAAIVPGLVLAILYGIWLVFSLKNQSSNTPALSKNRANDFVEPGYLHHLPVFVILLAVPLTILFGLATATEAASLGAALAVLLMAIQKGADFITPRVSRILTETLELTGVIFGIIIGASVLSLIFRGLEGDVYVEATLSAMPGEMLGALLFILVVIFLLGFIMEFVEIVFIVVPVAAPVLFALGVDPIWFAVLVAINLQISFLTPPLGISLFYFQSVSDIGAARLYSAVVPFIVLQLMALGLVFIIPELAIWLPDLLF